MDGGNDTYSSKEFHQHRLLVRLDQCMRPWPLLLALDACVFEAPVGFVESDAQEPDAAVLEKDAEAERDADPNDATEAIDADDTGEVANDAAFPDAAPECISGTLCSDDDFCTSDDFCVDSICIGHVLTGTCSAGCDQGCSGSVGPCCTEDCGAWGSCADCTAGRSCNTTCIGDCSATCRSGSACRVDQNQPQGNPSTTRLTCEAGASCELTCDGHSESDYECRLDCAAGSRCLLTCNGGNEINCELNCSGSTQDCGNNTYACDRDCPM